MEPNTIYVGNAIEVLKQWPDDSIDCVMTSPPYWDLRDYGTEYVPVWDEGKDCDHDWDEKIKTFKHGESATAQVHKGKALKKYDIQTPIATCKKCGAWMGQLGQEPTPDLYVKHLCDIFSEIYRVLKPTGTCFVNIGDTYKNNSKQMIPAKFAIAMMERGWTIRNEIIWHKTSSIPESVTNRFTNDYENIYFFTKNSTDYFFQQYRLPTRTTSKQRSQRNFIMRRPETSKGFQTGEKRGNRTAPEEGKNMRAVWKVKVGSYRGSEHIAKYSVALCKTPILTGCPEGGIVADPFMGSGTTGAAAIQLGRKYVGIEINQKDKEAAEKRIQEIKNYYGIE